MVKLRVAARVIPEDAWLASAEAPVPRLSLAGEKKFPIIIRDPDQWYIGRLANEVALKYKGLYKHDIGKIKYLKDNEDDCDLDPESTVQDLLLDEGKAATDASDQHVTIKVIQEQGRALRFGSVVPDLTPLHFQPPTRPPVPKFPQLEPSLGKRTSTFSTTDSVGASNKRLRYEVIAEQEENPDIPLNSIENDADAVEEDQFVQQTSPELSREPQATHNVSNGLNTVNGVSRPSSEYYSPAQLSGTEGAHLATSEDHRRAVAHPTSVDGMPSRKHAVQDHDTQAPITPPSDGSAKGPLTVHRISSHGQRMSRTPVQPTSSASSNKFKRINNRTIFESDIDDSQMSPRSKNGKLRQAECLSFSGTTPKSASLHKGAAPAAALESGVKRLHEKSRRDTTMSDSESEEADIAHDADEQTPGPELARKVSKAVDIDGEVEDPEVGSAQTINGHDTNPEKAGPKVPQEQQPPPVLDVPTKSHTPTAQPKAIIMPDGSKRYSCPQAAVYNCKQTFVDVKGALRHLQRIHINPARFRCLVCRREFTRKEALQKHERAHDKAETPNIATALQSQISGSGKAESARMAVQETTPSNASQSQASPSKRRRRRNRAKLSVGGDSSPSAPKGKQKDSISDLSTEGQGGNERQAVQTFRVEIPASKKARSSNVSSTDSPGDQLLGEFQASFGESSSPARALNASSHSYPKPSKASRKSMTSADRQAAKSPNNSGGAKSVAAGRISAPSMSSAKTTSEPPDKSTRSRSIDQSVDVEISKDSRDGIVQSADKNSKTSLKSKQSVDGLSEQAEPSLKSGLPAYRAPRPTWATRTPATTRSENVPAIQVQEQSGGGSSVSEPEDLGNGSPAEVPQHKPAAPRFLPQGMTLEQYEAARKKHEGEPFLTAVQRKLLVRQSEGRSPSVAVRSAEKSQSPAVPTKAAANAGGTVKPQAVAGNTNETKRSAQLRASSPKSISRPGVRTPAPDAMPQVNSSLKSLRTHIQSMAQQQQAPRPAASQSRKVKQFTLNEDSEDEDESTASESEAERESPKKESAIITQQSRPDPSIRGKGIPSDDDEEEDGESEDDN